MKTFSTVAFTAFLLLLGNSATLLAQQNTTTGSNKTITITKRSVDADGTETTETIVKKGKAAENFDVDKYVQENRSEKVQVEVQVEDQDSNNKETKCKNNSVWSLGDGISWGNGTGISWNDSNDTFLGVEQDSDEDEDEPGLTVQVVKGSAAAKSGLKTNDVILKLNNKTTNTWSDLSKTIRDAKPGDQLNITYNRNGKEATTVATLTKRGDLKCDADDSKHGFLGVNQTDDDNDEDESGVKVDIVNKSAAEKAGLRDGDKILKLNDTDIKDWEDISDFMGDTKPGDKIQVAYERDGKKSTAEAIAGEQQEWNWNSWSSSDNSNWDGLNVNIKEKDACLGVYTQTYTQNNTKGTRINGFTDESAAREVQMTEDDIITAVNGTEVKSHNDLWNEIAKYQPGTKVKVGYLRDDKPFTVEATLKACRDNSNQVIINTSEGEGKSQSREFYTWNWGKKDQERMRERRVITIHKGEGDTEKVNPAPAPAGTDRSLKLQSFKAYPNPTQGQITIEFQGEPVATVVSLFDLSGRQLFREELNAFNGDYNQQFDLSEYAKGTILIQVVQGEKVYTEQVVVN
jgi:S1-C subfamily serine protease